MKRIKLLSITGAVYVAFFFLFSNWNTFQILQKTMDFFGVRAKADQTSIIHVSTIDPCPPPPIPPPPPRPKGG